MDRGRLRHALALAGAAVLAAAVLAAALYATWAAAAWLLWEEAAS